MLRFAAPTGGALYQNVLPPGVVANRVEFSLFGSVPGSISLQGPLKPVEPLRVLPRDAVVAGEGRPALPGAGARTFGGAVEVAFEPPVLEIAGEKVTLGGASSVRLATTFLDDRIRIGRGGFGSLFVFERMPPGAQAAAALPCAPQLRAAGWMLARMALALFTVLSAVMDAARLVKRALTTPAVLLACASAAAACAYASNAATLPVLVPGAAFGAAHVLALGTWLGATLWVTFGQGDVLYRQLPRHAFSSLRATLRPRFLSASVALGAFSLASLAGMQVAAGADVAASLQLLRYALYATLANLLWAEPSGTRLAAFRDKFEADVGIGAEVGVPPNDDLLTPTLRRLNKRIGRLRAASALLTVVTLAASAAHAAALGARLALIGI